MEKRESGEGSGCGRGTRERTEWLGEWSGFAAFSLRLDENNLST